MEPASQMFKFSLETKDLRKTLWTYQRLGHFTDCTLIANCGRAINAHKMVLAASSEYLSVNKCNLALIIKSNLDSSSENYHDPHRRF